MTRLSLIFIPIQKRKRWNRCHRLMSWNSITYMGCWDWSSLLSVWRIEYIIRAIAFAHKGSAGKYLIIVTARALAATLQTHKIWKITAGSALPVGMPVVVDKGAGADEAQLAKVCVRAGTKPEHILLKSLQW